MTLRQPNISVIVSVLCGVLVFFLFKFYSSQTVSTRESWAVLAVDENPDIRDRQIRESLAALGAFISESSMEVLVDDFGAFKMIPLDSFYNEIEPFDPRNDGYAAKLISFFVRDGKRFFFLPLGGGISRPGKMKKQIASLLPDTQFSFVVLGGKRPVLLGFIFMAIASFLALYLSKSRRLFILEVPVLLALGWGGAAALCLAAILAGLWELLREPFGELYAARSYSQSEFDYAGAGSRGVRERLKPFRLNLLLVLLFFLLLLPLSIASEYSPIPLAAALLSFFLIYFLSHEAALKKARKGRHVLFTPVQIIPEKTKTFSLFPFLLPFAAAFALALLAPLLLPGLSSSVNKSGFIDPDYIVTPGDYRRHIAFQHAFSRQSLDESAADFPDRPAAAYLRYSLGEDGLISGSTGYTMNETGGIKDTPFPLEKLMGFLIQYYKPGISGIGR